MERKVEIIMTILMMTGLFAVSCGVTGAFLTDQPLRIANLITLGEVKLELKEPDWEEENGRDLIPGSVILKNPMAENTGKTDCWIFLQVSVPVRTICVTDPVSKRKLEPAATALFGFTQEEGWELIEKKTLPEKEVYLYGFQRLVKPGETTGPLFQYVTMARYLEGELSGEEIFEIPVKAMAVQKGVSEEGAGLAEIYQTYLKQEGRESSFES